jgi:uncharacterized protein
MDKNQLEPYLLFARKYHTNPDPAHDFRHIQRIVKRLDVLAEGFAPLNYSLLYFLACFHGLRKKINEDKRVHEEVIDFLTDLGWTKQEITEGLISLARHLENPGTPEEKIVHDANYLELLGAFGIAKAFTTGGFRGQTYEETIAVYESQYLEKIKFQTPQGKVLAEEGRDYARKFLERLKNELR